jgi:hypothetical protein
MTTSVAEAASRLSQQQKIAHDISKAEEAISKTETAIEQVERTIIGAVLCAVLVVPASFFKGVSFASRDHTGGISTVARRLVTRACLSV